MIPPAIPDGFQEKLRDYDPRLRVSWDYERNLWMLEERGMRTGQWRYVFYWCDKAADGSNIFRPLPTNPGPLLEVLAKLDFERLGVLSEADWRKFKFDTECKRMEQLRRRQKEDQDFRRQAMKARYPYHMAGRRTVELNRTGLPGKA